MGISLRIFLINDDNSIQPLATARYERLLNNDPKEQLSQYAGKRVRYALIAVDLINRKPKEVLKAEYAYLSFDSEGRLDPNYSREEAKFSREIIPLFPIERDTGPVIDARHKFAQKRYHHKYKWTPTPEIQREIARSIFKI